MDSSRVIRHSFEMLTPPRMTAEESEARKWTIVSIPLSNSKLLHLCSNLVTLCTTLIHAGVLEDMRQKLRDCAQASRGILAAYQQLVDFLSQAVETQVVNLPRWKHAMESNEESTWDLYEMLKHSEPWLIHEPWWVVLDTDDQEQAGDKDEGVLRPLPYLQVFTDYYRAIQDAVPSRQDIEVATSLRNAALTGAIGLTGEWHRQGEFDEHHLQQPHCVASIRSATTASSLSWFARCIHAHMTKTFQITETNETMTISLSNSLVSPDAVFLLQLNEPEPTVVFPQDYFPFGWSRKRLVMAYRAWRVRAIGDSNGSAVAVQFMRWPDHQDLELWEHDDEEDVNEKNLNAEREPEEEPNHQTGKFRRLRTRITMYFSVFSTTTLQVRTIVETSFAPIAITTSTTHPSEMDMLKYFKSPSSWEMRSQISQQYTKSL
ncbi:uncharacterized protein PHALS_01124 [Plasmopara halstedii]|uniref:Uncharacterized protein n=1 Tax=Plasmopara halstedii TaxID=4781 RepID=A0A0N7L6N7_PLAHL|nr:uncharacterized protein PHALS_01124 [Plasmopara halstedii]CEG44787.1 hypothetical protein PHALS_01124 [Plasmopara halstedii]|eukprot:XP_024581156.1 hypothetical protein PHALS_01124 [Plasmopara halstedii]